MNIFKYIPFFKFHYFPHIIEKINSYLREPRAVGYIDIYYDPYFYIVYMTEYEMNELWKIDNNIISISKNVSFEEIKEIVKHRKSSRLFY